MVTLIDNTSKTEVRHPEKAARADAPLLRKPAWIRVKAPGSPAYNKTREIVKEHGLVTVCEEAGCPNIGEWAFSISRLRWMVRSDEHTSWDKLNLLLCLHSACFLHICVKRLSWFHPAMSFKVMLRARSLLAVSG